MFLHRLHLSPLSTPTADDPFRMGGGTGVPPFFFDLDTLWWRLGDRWVSAGSDCSDGTIGPLPMHGGNPCLGFTLNRQSVVPILTLRWR
ncbi:hypothetical protein CDAR_20621 [Caerostris darwini]|uniref:Uncharacterized protein n=1 Tax=Caerostris darwini TaxID=1538125 RepID=A0AAV4QDB0_9ARAC|nr:hypothetical protein CDAR_20621 [Caerostris darwini]